MPARLVERAGRFVGDDQARSGDERACDADACVARRRSSGRAACGRATPDRRRRAPRGLRRGERCDSLRGGRARSPTRRSPRRSASGAGGSPGTRSPTCSPRQPARRSVDRRSMRSPSTTSEPDVGRSIPAIMAPSVLLPEPDGPTTATSSPRPIARSTLRTPTWAAPPEPQIRVRSRASISAAPAGGGAAGAAWPARVTAVCVWSGGTYDSVCMAPSSRNGNVDAMRSPGRFEVGRTPPAVVPAPPETAATGPAA